MSEQTFPGDPVVAQVKPFHINVEAGRRYAWCSCGRSASQPFCDGSHNNLVDEYVTDDRPRDQLLAETTPADFDAAGKALLDGGCFVRQHEAFQLQRRASAQPLQLLMTVCPGDAELPLIDAMPNNFDADFSDRAAAYDASQRKPMADRFYQVWIGEGTRSDEVSQFIGEVPRSKAAPHRHLCEQALVILSGHGTLWTETRRAPVRSGDLIFLPARRSTHWNVKVPGVSCWQGTSTPRGSRTSITDHKTANGGQI